MTKQDILNMKTSLEVTRTIFTHKELWDEEVKNYQMQLVRKENLEEFGDPDILVDPLKR